MDYSELKPVFDTVENAMTMLGIDYYLIGALARDYWYRRSKIGSRATKDVDFAILVGSQQEYEQVKNHLIEKEGYVQLRGNAYVLVSPEKHQVDLLPFGDIAHSGSVLIEGQGMTKISVDGMQEVYEHGTQQAEFLTGNTFKAATIPAIVLLKLIAFDDRPEARQKDAQDIGNILLHFYDMHEDVILASHLDLFPDLDEPETAEPWDQNEVGAIVLGREMGRIARQNQALLQRLVRILSGQLMLGEKSQFIRLIARDRDMEIEQVAVTLEKVLTGLSTPAEG